MASVPFHYRSVMNCLILITTSQIGAIDVVNYVKSILNSLFATFIRAVFTLFWSCPSKVCSVLAGIDLNSTWYLMVLASPGISDLDGALASPGISDSVEVIWVARFLPAKTLKSPS